MKHLDTDMSISFDYEKPELLAFFGDPMIVQGETSQTPNEGAYEGGGDVGNGNGDDY